MDSASGEEVVMEMKLNPFNRTNSRNSRFLPKTALSFLKLAVLVAIAVAPAARGDVLVPAGAVWRYLDDGSDPGVAWRQAAFEDSSWRSGPAQLGYGDGDEATLVRFGPNSGDRYTTTYFRHVFTVANPSVFTNAILELLRDDGAVVYLNDREIFRSNLPVGDIGYRTRASSNVSGSAESAFVQSTIAADNLRPGANLLAVEIHQAATNSSDISFDLRLSGIRPPMTVTLLAPVDGDSAATSPVTLSAAVTNPQNTPLTVTFHGRAGASAPGPDFTIVAVPDTQYYVSRKNGGTPEMFIAQTDWITANRAARNIAFVTQLGDCVESGDNGGSNAEWLHATNALYRLERPQIPLLAHGIPYGVAVGNHDQSTVGDPRATNTFYNQFFGVPHFSGRDYYGGHHGADNDNHFELFSASGLDFIVVHLEYDPAADPAVLNWANQLLQTHRDRRAIVVSHWIINAGNPASFSAQGQAIYNTLRTNANLFLMLCGHVSPEEGQRQDTFNGHTVYSLMSDYQSRPNGGNGWLRLLEFSPSNNVIRVRTYSPTLQQFETDADSQFDLPYDMRDRRGFSTLATLTDVRPGSEVSVNWTGLSAFTPHAWFATASDGTDTVLSPIQWFVTASGAATIEGSLPAPSALAAAAADPGQIRLTWTDNATNETSFVLERRSDGGSFLQVAILGTNACSFLDTGLTAATAYTYRIRCSDGVRHSDCSNTATATTQNDPAPSFRVTLTFDRAARRMVLTWPVQAGAVYRVMYRNSLTEGNWVELSSDIAVNAGIGTWSEPISTSIPSRFYAIQIVH